MKKKINLLSYVIAIALLCNFFVLYKFYRSYKKQNLNKANYLYVGSNIGLANLDQDIKIFFNTHDNTIGYQLMMSNTWETKLSKIMLNFVNPGDNIIDLGANYGTHSLRMAKKMNGQGKIYAFEANPKVFNLLRKSSIVNGLHSLIEPFNLLITDKNDEQYVFLYTDDFNVGGSKILSANDSKCKNCDFDKTIELSSSKLDTIIPVGTKINFMKMDIEGSEFLALAGAERVLNESIDDIVILMEWNYRLLTNPIEKIEQLVSKYGFKIWLVQGEEIVRIENLENLKIQFGDILLSRKELKI
jgi:FkbM family methyltransferase